MDKVLLEKSKTQSRLAKLAKEHQAHFVDVGQLMLELFIKKTGTICWLVITRIAES